VTKGNLIKEYIKKTFLLLYKVIKNDKISIKNGKKERDRI